MSQLFAVGDDIFSCAARLLGPHGVVEHLALALFIGPGHSRAALQCPQIRLSPGAVFCLDCRNAWVVDLASVRLVLLALAPAQASRNVSTATLASVIAPPITPASSSGPGPCAAPPYADASA